MFYLKQANKMNQHMKKYKCNKCGRVTTRASKKRWIKSYCEREGMYTRLYMIGWK